MGEFWREPMQVRSLVASGLPVPEGRAPLIHINEGPRADENQAWLNAGKACPTCLIKFPDRPCRATWHLFRGLVWGIPDHEAKKRVYAGCCPACGDPVETSLTLAQTVAPRDDWQHPDEQLRKDIEDRPIGTV